MKRVISVGVIVVGLLVAGTTTTSQNQSAGTV